MKAWLVYNQFEAVRNEFLIKVYFDEGKNRGIEFALLIEENLKTQIINGENKVFQEDKMLEKPDFIVFRTINQTLSEFMSSIAPIFNNPQTAKICNNKWLALEFVKNLGITIPQTKLVKIGEKAKPQRYPKIVKPVDGKGGKNVFLVENEVEYSEAVKNIGEHDFLIQNVMDKGRDMRVYVIDNRVIGAVLRKSDVNFKANFCLGGQAEVVSLNEKEQSIVDKIAKNLDIGYIGIDFMFNDGEPVFNEMEDVVGSRMLFSFTKVNPVSLYLDSILAKIGYIS